MRVATFNVNSVRIRLEVVLDWLAKYDPDVLVLQEIKADNDAFPRAAFLDAGWELTVHGQKRSNGVAMISKKPVEDVTSGMLNDAWPEDCRIQTAVFDGVRVINTYCPNGTAVGSEKFDYKLRWFKRFREVCEELLRPEEPAIWLGDINIAPTERDVFEAQRHLGRVGHHPDEFAVLDEVIEWGWTDVFRQLHPEGGHYSFWEFVIPKAFERNLGWRIDHIYASPALADKCTGCEIHKVLRAGERPSDHVPVMADFKV